MARHYEPENPEHLPTNQIPRIDPQRQQYPPRQPPRPAWVPPDEAQWQAAHQQPAKIKKKRRIFPWVFLAIQVLFLVWLIAGDHTTRIVVLWVTVDVFLVVVYTVFRLSRRK